MKVHKWIDGYLDSLHDEKIGIAFNVCNLIEEGRIEDAKVEAGRFLQAEANANAFRYATKHMEFEDVSYD